MRDTSGMNFYNATVSMVAIAKGVVAGEDHIIHTDPKNSKENGRYQFPLVSPKDARLLQERGLARLAGADDKLPEVSDRMAPMAADVEADRVAAVAAQEDGTGQAASSLSTRQTTNFPAAQNAHGGSDLLDDTQQDPEVIEIPGDPDVAPAPAAPTKPAPKPAIGKPAGQPKN